MPTKLYYFYMTTYMECEKLVKKGSSVTLHLPDGDYSCYFYSYWAGLTKFYKLSIKKIRPVKFLGFTFTIKDDVYDSFFDEEGMFYVGEERYIESEDFKSLCTSKIEYSKREVIREQEIRERIKKIQTVKEI